MVPCFLQMLKEKIGPSHSLVVRLSCRQAFFRGLIPAYLAISPIKRSVLLPGSMPCSVADNGPQPR
jgi:hypothetical protein